MSCSLHNDSSCLSLRQPGCCLLTRPDLEHQLAELPLVLLIAQKESLKSWGFQVAVPCTMNFSEKLRLSLSWALMESRWTLFFTPDAKTNKATMLDFLLDDKTDEVPTPRMPSSSKMGTTLFHAFTNLPHTFGAICLQILDQMVDKKHFIFSTDSYQPYSIKA